MKSAFNSIARKLYQILFNQLSLDTVRYQRHSIPTVNKVTYLILIWIIYYLCRPIFVVCQFRQVGFSGNDNRNVKAQKIITIDFLYNIDNSFVWIDTYKFIFKRPFYGETSSRFFCRAKLLFACAFLRLNHSIKGTDTTFIYRRKVFQLNTCTPYGKAKSQKLDQNAKQRSEQLTLTFHCYVIMQVGTYVITYGDFSSCLCNPLVYKRRKS